MLNRITGKKGAASFFGRGLPSGLEKGKEGMPRITQLSGEELARIDAQALELTRKDILFALESKGVDMDRIAGILAEAMSAVSVKQQAYFGQDGKMHWSEAPELTDYKTRLEAVKIAGGMLGADAPKKQSLEITQKVSPETLELVDSILASATQVSVRMREMQITASFAHFVEG